MYSKSFIKFLFLATIALGGAIPAFAQLGPISGTVEVISGDGTRKPVVGATVECFREDPKGSVPAATTNAKGQFSFAGVQVGPKYILSVSGPGIAPTYIPNIKANQEKILISATPGDGTKVDEDVIRKSAAAAAAGTLTQNAEEMRKAKADFESKKKEVEDKNKKASQANEITTRAVKEGRDAMEAKDYSNAIAKYTEGVAADPDYVGSAPVFLLNRGVAHTMRAVEAHNASVKATELAEREAVGAKVKQDLVDAAQSFLQGITVQKKAPAADIADKANFEATRASLLRESSVTFRRSVETRRVDPALIEVAKVLVPEYLTIETDQAKKQQASMVIAHMYRIAEDRENAVAAYKKVLETSPDNPDALAYAGIVLVDLGWLKDNDKALSQEGANYLQKFVSIAPDSHELKTGAVEYLNILKAQSIVPVKAPPAKKRP